MTEADAVHLGRIVRAARQDHGLSTPQLAEAVGIAQSNIVRLEQGHVESPSPVVLQRIATELDLPLTQLYRLAGIPVPALRPYLRADYGLSDQDVAQVQAYIQELASRYGTAGDGPVDGADELPELDN
jgi:transcriptional regulator with XRE-family HTH domain